MPEIISLQGGKISCGSEVSVCDQRAPLLLGLWQGRRSWQEVCGRENSLPHVSGKQRKREEKGAGVLVLVSFSLLGQNTWEKHTKREKMSFGSQFQRFLQSMVSCLQCYETVVRKNILVGEAYDRGGCSPHSGGSRQRHREEEARDKNYPSKARPHDSLPQITPLLPVSTHCQ
jgi:hypothetical protein